MRDAKRIEEVRRRRSPVCTCGHVFASHRLDPNDPYISERCKTCGCGGYEDSREASMQGDDE